MSETVLSEKLLADLAGWEAIKQARTILAENRVLSSCWQAPVLRGVVQSGTTSYRAGLVIRRSNDAENLCTCRQSREWGTLCAHSIAVGLHALKPSPQPAAVTAGSRPARGSGPAPPAGAGAKANKDARRLRRAGEGEPGEALALHVVFPPNLAEGFARGRGTVFFEGQWRRGQAPLDALPLDVPFRVEPEDARVLDVIESIAGGDSPAMLQAGAADFASLLEALAGHPRVTLGKRQAVRVGGDPWCPPLVGMLHPDGEITVRIRPGTPKPAVLEGDRPWVLADGALRRFALPGDWRRVWTEPMRWSRPQVPVFVGTLLPALETAGSWEANFTAADFELAPRPPRFHLHLAGGLAALSAQLHASYGSRVMTLGVTAATEAVWLPDPENPRRYATRDVTAEREAVGRLVRNGFAGPDGQGRFQLQGQNQVLSFFAHEFPRLEKLWQVTLEERLERSAEKHFERLEPRFAVTPSGEQWFDLQVHFAGAGGERLSMAEVQRLLRGGQGHARLKNGKIALLDTGAVEELEEILVDCEPRQHAGGYRMNQAQAGFLDGTFRQLAVEPTAPAAWRERARQQSGAVTLEPPPLGDLDPVLRPYQKQGVAWLAFLRRNGFGGILADEMGLGKTLQALAHLRAVHQDTSRPAGDDATQGAHEAKRPHLVVCPTSLVSNWVAEAQRFTPGMRVLPLHGSGRHADFARIDASDLVVTSYALVRRDLERYRGIEFDTVILDEAQHIKNRETRNAQAVKAIRSRHRLVLTGTPLENSVLDLWSIFDFLMPGYLGAASDFRERYEVPITREKSEAAQARLARRIRPFLLRRLKREVAPELPPRIDQVVWCDLSDEQAAVYQQILAATRREVTDAVGTQGLARSRMLVLTALLRLRQACCDLRLLGVEVPPAADSAAVSGAAESQAGSDAAVRPPPVGALDRRDAAEDTVGQAGNERADEARGGKIAAFAELLEEVIDGGHRVLVFSQFTRMLGLLKERLEAEGIRYCYLDGSTRDRRGVVMTFQGSGEIPVFLISLKAGGVGLNLTGADTVIHFDPWWNPAVEDQATDRAHRIGQARVVTSYKLIARGTVEEKILALQQRKREVIRSQLTGEEPLSESLTWEELRELLE